MALSAFDDKQNQPSDDDLKKALGKTYELWIRLREAILKTHGPAHFEWGFAGKSTGWGGRLKTDKRTIMYMTPCHGYFLASFALGEKAVLAAHAAKLPKPILETIDKAPKYAEGRGVRIKISKASDIPHIEKLAAIKMSN